ncbi:MAG: type VI secretion system tube protein Hcp, partial [Pseudomonadota bacterium]|nr:type VI secretion system tube protein Hcp [Pseudomonadota bacterium]
MFVEISDIEGDATEENHKNWIVIQSASWNVERAVEMTDLGSTQRMH